MQTHLSMDITENTKTGIENSSTYEISDKSIYSWHLIHYYTYLYTIHFLEIVRTLRNNIGLATKWLRILSLPPNGNIYNNV